MVDELTNLKSLEPFCQPPVIIPIGIGSALETRGVSIADELLGGKMALLGRPAVPLNLPIDWEQDPFGDRSWRFKLHSWEPQMEMCVAHCGTSRREYFDFAKAMCESWLQTYQQANSSMYGGEWGTYDMAAGKRAVVLAYIAACLESEGTRLRDGEIVDQGAQLHLDWLRNPENLTLRGNHGLFQLAGLLSLARQMPWLDEAESSAAYALSELERTYKRHYTLDGVHREHSPEYHQAMLLLACMLMESQLVPERCGLTTIVDRGINQLTWMVHPDGSLAAFGDSMGSGCGVNLLLARRSAALMWHYSRGRSGIRQAEQVNVSVDGGIATVRNALGSDDDFGLRTLKVGRVNPKKWSCLILQAAYHSETPQHKHADEGTFEWSHYGSRIVVDAGKYAYAYESLMRQYCESAIAHNTMALDDLPFRIKGPSKVPPASIGAISMDDGRMMAAALMHRSLVDRQSGPLSQDRLILGRVDRGLVVLDAISGPPDDAMATQWFHFHPDLEFRTRGRGMVAKYRKGAITVIPLSPWRSQVRQYRGQKQPSMQGWHSPKTNTMVENTAIGVHGQVSDRWFAAALLIADRGIPSLRLRRADGRIEVAQVDGLGEHLLVSVTAPSVTGHRILKGDHVGVPIARGGGAWYCDLSIDFDDTAIAPSRIARVLRLGLVTVRLSPRRQVQVITENEQVELPLFGSRLALRLIWAKSTGLEISSGGDLQGKLSHTGQLPSTAYFGEPVMERSWSGVLNGFSIRRGVPSEECNLNDVMAMAEDRALVCGLWNTELQELIKQDVVAQTKLK